MSNWDLPTTSDLYTDIINGLKARDVDSATMFKVLPVSPVQDMVRWDPTANKFDVYDGVNWVSLSSAYAINVTTFNGQSAAFYQSATNLNSGTLAGARFNDSSHGNRAGGTLHSAVVANGASGFITGSDKNKLNNIETNAKDDQTATEILNLLLSVNSVDGGNGINASTVNSYPPNVSSSINTLALRNGSGYLYANYFNTSGTAVSTNPTDVYVNTNDGFIRKQTKANFISNLGLSITTHLHTGTYKPDFVENTAFNKNFGVALGNVAQGNHLHTGVYNPVIGTDTSIIYSGASVVSSISLTDGVVTGHSARALTPANIGAAALASPAFSGTPTAPTPVQGTNNTQLATTSFVKTAPIADAISKTPTYYRHLFSSYADFTANNISQNIGNRIQSFSGNNVLTKIIEIECSIPGDYYFTIGYRSFDGYNFVGGGVGVLGIYKNDALVSSSLSADSTKQYYNQTLTFAKGDMIQIYVRSDSSGYEIYSTLKMSSNYGDIMLLKARLGDVENFNNIVD